MMEKILSEKVKSMSESATLKMAQLARDLKAEGKEVISLSLGEPDFDTPEFIKDAATQALADGYTNYSPVPGMPELRKAISEKFQRDNNLDYSPEQIMVSNGAKQSIANICMSTLDEGDEVIVFTPYWVSYHDIVEMIGGKIVPLVATIEEDFKVSATQLEEAITDDTKLVIFSSPCNPTGSVYTQKELNKLADVLAKQDILIISDEIYEHINFTDEHASIGAIPSVREQTVTVNGFSKGYAMTGWRMGYFGGPDYIVKAATKIQGQFTSGATTFSQIASAKALNTTLPEQAQMKEAFRKRRDIVIDALNDVPGFKCNNPQGAFYIFPDVKELIGAQTEDGDYINNSQDLSEYFLQEALVAVVAGSAFGLEDHLRLSYATSRDELLKAITNIKKAVLKLNGR